MVQQAEQGVNAPEAIHSPSDWAAKLRDSTKVVSEEDKQPLDPQEEEQSEEEQAELESDSTSEDPASDEDQDAIDEEGTEADAGEESEETEPLEAEPESAPIVADATYLVDGEEIDGQTLLNGIAATKNFAQEKHRLRAEAQETLDVEVTELHKQRDDYAAGLQFMLGVNRQAQNQYNSINWVELQMANPAEYQKQTAARGQLIAAQQQLQGQFDQFIKQVQDRESEKNRRSAQSSISILNDTFGGEEGWSKRYPQLQAVAEGYGFQANEFNTLTDHRFMAILDDLESTKAKLSAIESTASKKTKNMVVEKRKRNSNRVNTTPARKQSDAHTQFLKSRSPKDAAKMLVQSQDKRGRNGR